MNLRNHPRTPTHPPHEQAELPPWTRPASVSLVAPLPNPLGRQSKSVQPETAHASPRRNPPVHPLRLRRVSRCQAATTSTPMLPSRAVPLADNLGHALVNVPARLLRARSSRATPRGSTLAAFLRRRRTMLASPSSPTQSPKGRRGDRSDRVESVSSTLETGVHPQSCSSLTAGRPRNRAHCFPVLRREAAETPLDPARL